MPTREHYHKALQELQDDALRMADMVKAAVAGAMAALEARDVEESKLIIFNDLTINRVRFNLEERCIALIATQQPMAVDLRTLATLINMITDLERIGDHAEGIARISVMIGDRPLVKPLDGLPKMASLATGMLERCMKAFVERDVEAAKKVCDEDDLVDGLYDTTYRELIRLMILDERLIEDATYLIWAAHNLERIADRVTNIAERVVYMVTGKMQELNISKY